MGGMLVLRLAAAALLVSSLQAAESVSYYNQVRPIIQKSCSGCHQPANKLGGLVLTEHPAILKGGSKNGPAVRAGAPAESPMIAYVTGKSEPRMPMGGEPLPASDIAMLEAWINEGAVDDTPAEARAPQVPKEPPTYTQAPVVTAIAYSPDGKLLAVGGYREVLLHRADGSKIEARLLGRAEKIHSVAFTSDGSKLIAVGGSPVRFGEIQVWDVAKRKLERSILATNDTFFGGSLSPDGSKVVVGCTDNSVRMYDLATGEELFKAGHHEDWVLGTSFGIDGKRIVTVGRDRAAKLADADTGAFRENVNLLRDSLNAVVRHPRRDYVLIGGEDRVPYLYMMDRPRALKIADDSTLVKQYEEQKARIHALEFSPDGGWIAVGGMSDEVPIYDVETGERRATCSDLPPGTFVIRSAPDGKTVAVAGFDGNVRLFNSADGSLVKKFTPVPISASEAAE